MYGCQETWRSYTVKSIIWYGVEYGNGVDSNASLFCDLERVDLCTTELSFSIQVDDLSTLGNCTLQALI